MYLSDKQVAKKYGIHRTTVWRWVSKGRFPKPIKLSEGCTRWHQGAIEAWEHEKNNRPEAD